MDQFKPEELERMEKGGNEPFTEYLTSHGIDLKLPLKVKYDNPIASDYKDKLTASIEGTTWEEPDRSSFDPASLTSSGHAAAAAGKTTSPAAAGTNAGSRSENAPLESRRTSPSVAELQKEKNEAYFAELGSKNQSRSEALPPSQGGKYQGFGNTPVKPQGQDLNGSLATLSLGNLQKDPLGTFSKGWSLFSSAVTKSMEEVNDTMIKPGVQQIQSKELSEEAKRAAAQFGQKFQETSSYGFQAFSNFTKTLQGQYQQASQNAPAAESQFSKLFDSMSQEHENKVAKASAPNSKKPEDEWDEF